MPQYFSPGVYVEEKDPGPRPIVGVSTSVAGAVGVTVRGPTSGKPVLVTSFADFTAKFGGYMAEPANPPLVKDWADNATEGGRWWQFAHSVEGFFLNGGQQLFVKRVFASAAVASNANLGGGLVSPLAEDAKKAADGVTLEHLIGFGNGVQFRLFRGDTGADLGTFTVGSYDPVGNRVTFGGGAKLPEDLEAGRDFAQVQPRTPAQANRTDVADADATLKVSANARGAWGDALSTRVLPMIGATLGILPDPGRGPAVFSRVVVPANQGATTVTVLTVPNQLDEHTASPFTVRIGDRIVPIGAAPTKNPTPNRNWTDLTVPALPEALTPGTTVQLMRPANLPGPNTDKLFVSNAGRLYPGASVELDNRTNKELTTVKTVTGSLVTLNAALANTYLEDDRLRLIEAKVQVRYAPADHPQVDE
jgi:hypothetical protein